MCYTIHCKSVKVIMKLSTKYQSDIYQTTYSSCPVYCILLPSRKVPAPRCTIQPRYHQTGSDGSLDVDIISLTSQNMRPFGEILRIPWEPGWVSASKWGHKLKGCFQKLIFNMVDLKILLHVDTISWYKEGAGIWYLSSWKNDNLVILHN